MKELFNLFLVFARIGGFTFGGGYAMLPMIQKEIVENKKWATEEEIMNYYAVGQCTPGVIAVNVSTFVGMKRKGVIGAIFSTLGMITPSLIIITIIAAVLTNFASYPAVIHAFSGIRVAVLAMMPKTIITLIKKGVKDVLTLVIFVAVALTVFFPVSPVIIVFVAALCGIFYKRLAVKSK